MEIQFSGTFDHTFLLRIVKMSQKSQKTCENLQKCHFNREIVLSEGGIN